MKNAHMKIEKQYTVAFVLTINGETVAQVQDSGTDFAQVVINIKDYLRLFEESEKTV